MNLSEILKNGQQEDLQKQWDATRAAAEFAPLPAGEYIARILAGELEISRAKSTPGYRLAFRVLEGAHANRQFWLDIWLTPAALPMAKRDLAKIGITELDQLERPIQQGIRCRVQLTLRRDDAGTERNHVRRFEVVGIDEPEADPFAPQPPISPDDECVVIRCGEPGEPAYEDESEDE
jgi:hypothetical protein